MLSIVKKYSNLLFAGVVLLTLSTSTYAASLDLYGDKDCFGTGGACVEDGVTWALSWGEESADASDPIWTDRTYSSGETASWTHTFTAGAYTSAFLTFRTAGIADISGPYDVIVDGEVVGQMPYDGYGHILAKTFSFAIDSSYLLDGILEVSFSTVSGDWWALDYAEITASPVPVPGAIFLFGPALLGLVGLGRKRKALTA